MRSTLLLLSPDPELAATVASAAREAGWEVSPGRTHELAIDSLTRAPADVALVHVQHDGADSIAFGAMAQYRGTRVLLFANRDGSAEERARVSIASARTTFPVLQYSGDPAELIAAIGTARA